MRFHATVGLAILLVAVLFSAPGAAQQAAPPLKPPSNLTLAAPANPLPAESLLDPESAGWTPVPARMAALNRTPPLYDTDPPSQGEISQLEVRAARAGGRLLLHLRWRDSTEDTASLAIAPAAPPEQRIQKEHTAATERFFDAAAVMFPTQASPGLVSPSLQMGDPQQPVTIYYWNATRGAMILDAHGRGTTRRTPQSFPARGIYRAGVWRVVMMLPDLPPGVPLAFAVWNGSQLDRDGRKYFSVWHWLE